MKTTITSLLVFILLLSSCSEQKSTLLNKKISKNNIIELSEKLGKDKLISNLQLEEFKSGLGQIIAENDTLVGRTVAEIISKGNSFNRKSVLASTIKNSSKAEISLTLAYQLKSINPVDNENGSYNIATFIFQNNSDIDINKVDGTLEIRYKSNNKLLKNLPVLFTDIIPAGKAIQKNINYVHDPKNNRDILFRQDMNKLIAIWVPKSIDFMGGKKIKI
jgi:hypothetical protein